MKQSPLTNLIQFFGIMLMFLILIIQVVDRLDIIIDILKAALS